MSVSPAEQVLVSAAQVAATTFCDFEREARAVTILREVLPLVPVDARRAAYCVRVHAETLARADEDRNKDGYEAARRMLRLALVDFFEGRMAASYESLRGTPAPAAGQ